MYLPAERHPAGHYVVKPLTLPRTPDSRARSLLLGAPNSCDRKSPAVQNPESETAGGWVDSAAQRAVTCLKGGVVLLRGTPLGPEVLTLPGTPSRPASPLSPPPSPCPPSHHLHRTLFPSGRALCGLRFRVPAGSVGRCQFPGTKVERRRGTQCGLHLALLQPQPQPGGRRQEAGLLHLQRSPHMMPDTAEMPFRSGERSG